VEVAHANGYHPAAMDPNVIAARARLLERLRSVVGDGEIPRLDEALTHPSFANEAGVRHYQRLEFLGDAVLGLCVSELLSQENPDADEGTLTRMRAALVNAEALAQWARAEGLGACLALGRGARAGGEREQTNVLADAVEAIVAAVYEGRGMPAAKALVREVVRAALADADHLAGRDPKSALQERVQARGLPAPSYRVVGSRGPQHEPMFEVEVLIGEQVIARGEGRSKRTAERVAAAAALTADVGARPPPSSR